MNVVLLVWMLIITHSQQTNHTIRFSGKSLEIQMEYVEWPYIGAAWPQQQSPNGEHSRARSNKKNSRGEQQSAGAAAAAQHCCYKPSPNSKFISAPQLLLASFKLLIFKICLEFQTCSPSRVCNDHYCILFHSLASMCY